MSLQAVAANPFMLLVNPEVVLAAVEKSERLNGLNRHTCRPLDKVMPGTAAAANAADALDASTGEEIDTEGGVSTEEIA
jgi:hypothetical protein